MSSFLIIFSFLCTTLISQPIISGTWEDQFTGWIYSDWQSGQTDSTTIGLITYHGPYPSIGGPELEIYNIQQLFYCDKPSAVDLTYYIYFCGTESTDYVQLILNGVSFQIGLDIASTGSSYTDEELGKAVNNNCNTWKYLAAGPYSISSININELFNVTFQIRVSYEPEAIAISRISITCNPLPTSSPTQTPTTVETQNPTLSPTADTQSPTSNTASPTTDTQTPTLNTASPTAVTPSPTSITPVPTSITPVPTSITAGPTSITETPTANTPSPTSVTSGPTTDTQPPTSITAVPTLNTVSPTSNTAAVPTAITTNPTVSPTDNPTVSPIHVPTVYTSNPTRDITNNPTVSPTNNPITSTSNIQINVPNINVPILTKSNPSLQTETTTKTATVITPKTDTGNKSDTFNEPDFQQKLSIILILILIICCMTITLFIIKRYKTKKKKVSGIKLDEESQIKGDIAISTDTTNKNTSSATNAMNTNPMNTNPLSLEQRIRIQSNSVMETNITSQLQTGDVPKSKAFTEIQMMAGNTYDNDDNNHSDVDSDNHDDIDGDDQPTYDPKRESNKLYDDETPRFPEWHSSTTLKKQKTNVTVYKMEGIMENDDKYAMPAGITKGGEDIAPNEVNNDDDAMSEDDGLDNNNNNNNNNYITPNALNGGGNIAMPMDDNKYVDSGQTADGNSDHAMDQMAVDYVDRSVARPDNMEMTKGNIVAMPMDDKYVSTKGQNPVHVAMPMNDNYNTPNNRSNYNNYQDIEKKQNFNNNYYGQHMDQMYNNNMYRDLINPSSLHNNNYNHNPLLNGNDMNNNNNNNNIPNRMKNEYMNNNYSNYQHNQQ